MFTHTVTVTVTDEDLARSVVYLVQAVTSLELSRAEAVGAGTDLTFSVIVTAPTHMALISVLLQLRGVEFVSIKAIEK